MTFLLLYVVWLCWGLTALRGAGGVSASTSNKHNSSNNNNNDRLVLTADSSLTIHVDAWGDDSVRVRVTLRNQPVIEVPVVQALLPEPPPRSSSSLSRVVVHHRHHQQDDDNKQASSPTRADTFDPSFLQNGNLRVTEYPVGSGMLRFERVSDGTLLLQQSAVLLTAPAAEDDDDDENTNTKEKVVATGQGMISFEGFPTGTAIYGFGEHRGGPRCTDSQCTNTTLPIYTWDWNISHSQDIRILPNNGNAWVPFFQTSTGLGFLWNLPSYGHVHVGSDHVTFSTMATLQLDYYVTTTTASSTATPPYADLLRHYVAATGHPPILPHAYTGFWQCKNRYSSQKQILDIATTHMDTYKLPLSVIVIDYNHWKHYGDWQFDPNNTGCWPDPRAMVEELQKRNVQVAVSVWPSVDAESMHFSTLMRRRLLVRGKNGLPKLNLEGAWTVDAFNPKTRKYLWDRLVQGYAQLANITTFWFDATEPECADIGNWYYKLEDGKIHRDAEVGMAWVLQYHRMAAEGLTAFNQQQQQQHSSSGNNDNNDNNSNMTLLPPFLTRSAFAGSQRYGAILWSGDIESTFDELAVQVQTAQHVSMSGLYLWTTDIGGYRGSNTTDPVFRELLVRWFQFGAFCPIFRLHGDRGGPQEVDFGYHTCRNESSSSCVCGRAGYNEVWKFGPKAFSVISKLMWLREDLRNYISHHLYISHELGIPILRPMVFDFVDEACVNATDQFMFGDTWLVSPVLSHGSKAQQVYLPKLPPGQEWLYYYRDKEMTSDDWPDGSWVTVPTPTLGVFPLFVRCFNDGSLSREFDFCRWHNGNHPQHPAKSLQKNRYSSQKQILDIATTHMDTYDESTILAILRQIVRTQQQARSSTTKNDRPFVSLCFAQSLDGKLAQFINDKTDDDGDDDNGGVGDMGRKKTCSSTRRTSSNLAISGASSLLLTHALRSAHDGILIGGRTLWTDNPRLSNRLWQQQQCDQKQPRPVVLDALLCNYRLVGAELRVKNPIVCHSDKFDLTSELDDAHKDGKNHNDVTLLACQTHADGSLDLIDVLTKLRHEFGIQSLMVEGGPTTLGLFLKAQLFDCACITVSPTIFGSGLGISLPGTYSLATCSLEYYRLQDDLCLLAFNNK